MFTTNRLPVLNYKMCEELLGDRESKKLCNETYLKRHDITSFSVELMGNKILQIHSTFIIATYAGWPTVTTKQRLNKLTNHLWFQKDYEMFVTKMSLYHPDFDYKDCIPVSGYGLYKIRKSQPIEELEG